MEFTKEEIKEYITDALRMRTGDDLERCKGSFMHMSNDDMEREHGQSGRTKKEVLEGYERERRLYNVALEAVTGLKG